MRNKNLNIMVEGAMMIAFATVLSFIKLYELPQGGSITLEMIPLVVMGLRHGTKWGLFTAFIHGLLQLIFGFNNVLYCNTLLTMIGCILLDYLVAFTCLGLAGGIADKFTNRTVGSAVGGAVCGFLRFMCSFLSGWLVWASYYEISGMELAIFSLGYNASYMVPNTIIMVIVLVLLSKTAPKIIAKQD